MFSAEEKPRREKKDGFDTKKKASGGGFQSMGFSWQILKSIINSGYKQPTPIQRKAIPEILLGKDLVAMARTGSGKTAAFLLPMFQRLQEKSLLNADGLVKSSKQMGPRAIVMSPTRELALQTFKFAKQFGKYIDFKVAVILGGDKIEDQFETMHENPDIIIATPGRFLHICIEMNLKLSSIEYIVFDEADRLFEMGFKEQLNEILSKLPESRQTLLFSATLPQSLVEFARAGLQSPTLIRLDTESKLSDKLKIAFFHCRAEDKLAFLIYLIENIIKAVKNPSQHPDKKLEQTIIFVATKHHVEFLRELLLELGYLVSYAYSSLDQAARQINLGKFQAKKTSILIVTDVAARGLDIPMLDNVINFNFPAKAKLYVHRVGRVARAGNYGSSYSLVTNDELPYMYELFEILAKPIRFATDEMSPDDWNEVYGSIPQEVIDIQRDELISLVESKVELKCAFQVQENAYKHYLKSRPLPSTNSIRSAKNIRAIYQTLPIHPILRQNQEFKSEYNTHVDLLDRLKNLTTRQTIFEVNKATSNKSAQIMRKKREIHDKVVDKYKNMDFNLEKTPLFQNNKFSIERDMFRTSEGEQNLEADEKSADENVIYNDDHNLVIKITNNSDDQSSNKTNNKRKSSSSMSKVEKRKILKSVKDEDNYIPYKPKNYNTEKALGINTNFNREMNDATMDLVADDESDLRRNLQKTKWDRKKKKFVSVQSILDKSKKIKTESGSYIKASYKKDLYSKWLKNYKALDRDHGDQDDDGNNEVDKVRGKKGDDSKKNKKFFGSSLSEKKYFGNNRFKSKSGKSTDDSNSSSQKYKRRRPNEDMNEQKGGNSKSGKNKRFSVGLKSKEHILKERDRKTKVKRFQNRKQSSNGKSKSGGKKWKNKRKF